MRALNVGACQKNVSQKICRYLPAFHSVSMSNWPVVMLAVHCSCPEAFRLYYIVVFQELVSVHLEVNLEWKNNKLWFILITVCSSRLMDLIVNRSGDASNFLEKVKNTFLGRYLFFDHKLGTANVQDLVKFWRLSFACTYLYISSITSVETGSASILHVLRVSVTGTLTQ